ncbi:MAG: helix-turn-helix domain-containing protein [Bacteroidota bacterium]
MAEKAESLLQELGEVVEANLTNAQFGVEDLAKEAGIGRTHLRKQLQAATGQSISQFIREYRLKRSLDMLGEGDRTISEIAYSVGFSSPSYFTACFTEHFGHPPGEAKVLIKSERIDKSKGRNHEEVSTKKLRTITLSAAGAIAVIATSLYLSQRQDTPPSTQRPAVTAPSIAILPFRDLSPKDDQAYFSEGIVSTIATKLTKIRDLHVVSQSSSNQFVNRDQPIQEIAKELNARHLLEGTIQRSGTRVRINVVLNDATTQKQLWAENYDRQFEDIFQIQTDIAEQVASALSQRLSAQERNEIQASDTKSSEAYDLYLKGMYAIRMYTDQDLKDAARYMQEAVSIDSTFAAAYAGLAYSHIGQAAIYSARLDATEAMRQGKPFLEKALALDPAQEDALVYQGFYLLYNDWDFAGAEGEYRKALPSNTEEALAVYCDFLNFLRRHEEALVIAERLNTLHPFYPGSRMALTLYYLGSVDEAIKYVEDRLKHQKSFMLMDSYGFVLLNSGKYDAAVSVFEEILSKQSIRLPREVGWMGAALAKKGERQAAMDLIDELEQRSTISNAGSPAFFIAVIYAALEEYEASINWLRKSIKDHEMEVPWLVSDPQLYPLHDDPRFEELVEEVGFPSYAFPIL